MINMRASCLYDLDCPFATISFYRQTRNKCVSQKLAFDYIPSSANNHLLLAVAPAADQWRYAVAGQAIADSVLLAADSR